MGFDQLITGQLKERKQFYFTCLPIINISITF